MDNDKTIIERLVRIEQDAQSIYDARIVREHSESTNRMEADMSRALRMLDEEFASQMKKDADEIVKEILK